MLIPAALPFGDKMKTSIIPIFIPHIGCPHRCVFCNQWQITGHRGLPKAEEVRRQIDAYTAGVTEKRHWEAAFYGGSFTAIPARLQELLLQPAYAALQAGKIAAIRCSTRPDCIDDAVIARLRAYGLTCVELGVQSMDDSVLQAAKRGHSAADVVQATRLLRAAGFCVGHQLMPGLPGEDWESLQATTEKICRLRPDIARIYPVAVLKDTELAEMYQKGRYTPLTIAEGVKRAAYMKQKFLEHGIQCIRTGLQATADLDDDAQVLAGAYTPAMGELADSRRYGRKILAVLRQLPGRLPVTIEYHRRDTSRVRGYHNVTVKTARWSLPELTIYWREGNNAPGEIRIRQGEKCWQLFPDQPIAAR